MHKFKAQKTTINGITFPSKLEASVYKLLLMRQASGEISDTKLQQAIVVKDRCPHCGDGPIVWKIDFSFTYNGQTAYAEAKGVATASYIKRLRLFKKNRTERLEIWKGSWRNPAISEVINP